MKNQIVLSLMVPLIAASMAIAQQPLSVDVSIVQVEAVKQTVVRTILSFEDAELAPTESITKAETKKIPAALITVSEPATVDAFSKDFDVAEVTPAGNNRFLLTGKPGKYMAVVDTGDRNKYVPIVIPGATVPDEPIEPPPVDDLPDFASLADSSATLASKVNDPPTRTALAKALGQELTGSFADMRAEIQSRVETTMLARPRESRTKDWINGWRRPMSEEMVKLKVETPEQYRAAIRQIVVGLERSAQSSMSVLKTVPTLAPVQTQPVPFITQMLPRATTRMVPVTRRVCGPFGVCRDVTEWIEVTQ